MKRLVLLTTVLLAANAYAASFPRELSADHRVKEVMYDPNNVVIINGKYGYETDITFAPNETVQNVSIGDSMAWQAVPVKNNLFIKPLTLSKTNMTVLTSANSYNFQLNSNNSTVQPTYKLQFIYPTGGYDAAGNSQALATFNPAKLNSEYSFTGDRALAPTSAFDNGTFTYFKFNHTIPAIYIVDSKQKETLVNYHMQGQYVVVDTTAPQFTLRHGDEVTSVYNDKAIGDWHTVKGGNHG